MRNFFTHNPAKDYFQKLKIYFVEFVKNDNVQFGISSWCLFRVSNLYIGNKF